MSIEKYLDVAPEVKEALAQGKPVVALESTIISHGMPYPQNVETALNVEKVIRDNGAIPATIAIIGGEINPLKTVLPEPIFVSFSGITKSRLKREYNITLNGIDKAV